MPFKFNTPAPGRSVELARASAITHVCNDARVGRPREDGGRLVKAFSGWPGLVAQHQCSLPYGDLGRWQTIGTAQSTNGRGRYVCPECEQHWMAIRHGDLLAKATSND